jgi:hypothetical protein
MRRQAPEPFPVQDQSLAEAARAARDDCTFFLYTFSVPFVFSKDCKTVHPVHPVQIEASDAPELPPWLLLVKTVDSDGAATLKARDSADAGKRRGTQADTSHRRHGVASDADHDGDAQSATARAGRALGISLFDPVQASHHPVQIPCSIPCSGARNGCGFTGELTRR